MLIVYSSATKWLILVFLTCSYMDEIMHLQNSFEEDLASELNLSLAELT